LSFDLFLKKKNMPNPTAIISAAKEMIAKIIPVFDFEVSADCSEA
jgi:hypothetical protein